MKAAVFHNPRDIRIEDIRRPEINSGEALVRVKMASICGTDLSVYKGERKVPAPIILGHEFAGEIIEVGGDLRGFEAGERVVIEPTLACGRCPLCRSGRYNICEDRGFLGLTLDGCFAEYVKVPERSLWKIPKDMGYEEGAMVEPAAVGIHAIDRAGVKVGDYVAISGAGAIGLFALQVAKIAGARTIVIDRIESRLRLAEELGSDAIINASEEDPPEAIKGLTEGMGADIAIEASGSHQASAHSAALVRPGGRVVWVGLAASPVPVSQMAVVRREIEIFGSLAYVSSDFKKSIHLISSGKIKTEPIITHKFSLDEITHGLALLERQIAIKVLIETE